MNKTVRLYPEQADDPVFMANRAADEYTRWSNLVRQGGHLGLPWANVHNLTGPLLPGWLVLVGARSKGGKSTFLREVFHSWVSDFGKRVLYVGTEQNAGNLRALWACLRCRLPQEAAIDPKHPDHPKVIQDIAAQANLAGQAMIEAEPAITVDIFTEWARFAYLHKCDALIFDHFHRLEDDGASQHRSRNAAIRQIKNVAVKSNMVIVVAAQLKNGEGKLLGEYQVPGYDSWAETAGLRRECDVGIQLWRPFKAGVTREQKMAANDDATKIPDIVQANTMAVRCDAHRYRDTPCSQMARLSVNQGELTTWGV